MHERDYDRDEGSGCSGRLKALLLIDVSGFNSCGGISSLWGATLFAAPVPAGNVSFDSVKC